MDDLLHTLRTYDPHDATAQAAMVGAAAEIERLTAWQEKVCAIVQPARADEVRGAFIGHRGCRERRWEHGKQDGAPL